MQIIEKRRIWFTISFILLLPGIISLFLYGLRPGIDFRGGSLSEYSLEQGSGENAHEKITQIFHEEGAGDVVVITDESSENDRFLVKSQNIEHNKHTNIVRRLSEGEPKLTELSFETIDPQVGAEATRRAIYAIGAAAAAIIVYIAYSFKGVSRPASPWQFGVSAVVALLHDVLFILGFYSIMGQALGWEVNADFVIAALTVMGFSVHDTIVVYDRLRENFRRMPSASFTQIANASVAQTMARSINTSLTVVFVLLAIVLLGGASIRPFTLTLLVGIVVGTFSSIFVATPLLSWWQDNAPRTRRMGQALTKAFSRIKLPARRKRAAKAA